jgi:hypothetical protein
MTNTFNIVSSTPHQHGLEFPTAVVVPAEEVVYYTVINPAFPPEEFPSLYGQAFPTAAPVNLPDSTIRHVALINQLPDVPLRVKQVAGDLFLVMGGCVLGGVVHALRSLVKAVQFFIADEYKPFSFTQKVDAFLYVLFVETFLALTLAPCLLFIDAVADLMTGGEWKPLTNKLFIDPFEGVTPAPKEDYVVHEDRLVPGCQFESVEGVDPSCCEND